MKTKTKLLSFVLAICLISSLLALPAAAAGNISDMNGAANINATFSTTTGGTVSSSASGRAKVIIFCMTTCYNCISVSQELADNQISDYADVIVAFTNSDSDSNKAVDSFIGSYGIPGAYYSYYSSYNNDLLWQYARMLTGDEKVTSPLTVLVDSDNTIDMMATGASGVSSDICTRLGIASGTPSGQRATSGDTSYWAEEWEVLALTNKERAANGMQPLTMIPKMQQAAHIRAIELCDEISHTRPDGTDCFTVFNDVGLSYTSCAENIAGGQRTPEEVVDGWISSAGHHKNMLSSNCHIGVGYEEGGNYGTNWVQLFLTDRCSVSALSVRLPSGGLTVKAGTPVEDFGAVVHANCAVHGDSYCPLISQLCTGYDSSVTGTQTVTVSAYGLTTTFDVTVTAGSVTVESVSIKSRPGKTSYTVGDTLDTAGLALTVTKSDGSTENVASGFTCSPTKLNTAGTQTITVSYGGKSATFDVTVAENTVPNSSRFCDVYEGQWYYSYVMDLSEKGILTGDKNSDGSYSFRPQGRLTRSEFAAILARASGESLAAYRAGSFFTDVPAGNWASPYVEWANANGIATGSGGAFRPQDNISRQEMAAMINRFNAHMGRTLTPTASTLSFTDAAAIDSWAADSITVLQTAGVIGGIPNGDGSYRFNPQGSATRAEASKMISVLLSL